MAPGFQPPVQRQPAQTPAQTPARQPVRRPGQRDLVEQSRLASVLTPGEVAWIFRVDPKTITRWCKAGRFPEHAYFRTLGGHRRYLEDVLDEVLSKEIPEPRRRKAMFDEAKRLSAQGRIREPDESIEARTRSQE